MSSRPKGGSPGVGAAESSSSNPSDAIKWANITMLAVLCSSTRRTVVPRQAHHRVDSALEPAAVTHPQHALGPLVLGHQPSARLTKE
ncbi:hypothetical protein ACIA6D_40985 [Streptomyces cacaoi]|uniref:hypothetical protein n=1 Tax=Streptomyces cacaoi TaxID=1898 RepID=UPI00374811C2